MITDFPEKFVNTIFVVVQDEESARSQYLCIYISVPRTLQLNTINFRRVPPKTLQNTLRHISHCASAPIAKSLVYPDTNFSAHLLIFGLP